MKTENKNYLQTTLDELKTALTEWDQIPSNPEVNEDLDKFRKKTQEILLKLSEQIKALDL